MATWQKANGQARGFHHSDGPVFVHNQTYNKQGAGMPGAGNIGWYPDRCTYTVANMYTRQTHEHLATEDQVEQALKDLDIQNSSWVFYL